MGGGGQEGLASPVYYTVREAPFPRFPGNTLGLALLQDIGYVRPGVPPRALRLGGVEERSASNSGKLSQVGRHCSALPCCPNTSKGRRKPEGCLQGTVTAICLKLPLSLKIGETMEICPPAVSLSCSTLTAVEYSI